MWVGVAEAGTEVLTMWVGAAKANTEVFVRPGHAETSSSEPSAQSLCPSHCLLASMHAPYEHGNFDFGQLKEIVWVNLCTILNKNIIFIKNEHKIIIGEQTIKEIAMIRTIGFTSTF